MKYLLPILSLMILAAHYLRYDLPGSFNAALLPIFLLAFDYRWILKVFKVGLLIVALIWVGITAEIAINRMEMMRPWLRMAVIMSSVIFFTALSSLVFWRKSARERFDYNKESSTASAWAFFLTFGLLAIVQYAPTKAPMLLLERFLVGGGWLQAMILSIYAAWLTGRLHDKNLQPQARKLAWGTFSFVFFAQLLLGLLVHHQFLLTGKLHLPVPAMILAGPIYRVAISVMPILFIITVIIAGPAWCSHLCYIGSWDLACAQKNKPTPPPPYAKYIRIGILLGVIMIAILLNALGASATIAAILGGAFGIIGLLVMLIFSRRMGSMIHCTVFCPIGLLASIVGKLSIFKIKIDDSCTSCGSCTKACKYNALLPEDIKNRRPSLKCTLCGDCIQSCPHSSIDYTLAGRRTKIARTIFIVTIVTLHALFLGTARI